MQNFQKRALWIGLILIGLSVFLALLLDATSSWEQARSPGEKDMGVAVLAIMFGVPSAICAVAGGVSLLASATVFTWSRLAGNRGGQNLRQLRSNKYC